MQALKYKAVFFDWDDTLWDFHANAYAALQMVFAKHCMQRFFASFDSFYALYSAKNAELWALYGRGEITKDFLRRERFRYPFQQVGVSNDDLAWQVGEDFLQTTTMLTALCPHARDVVETLSKRVPLTIISNGFSEVQHHKIERSGLADFFSHTVLSEDVGVQKPDVRIFEKALFINGLQSNEVLMVGDNYDTDIMGARAANIDQFYVAPQILPNQTATYYASSLHDVLALF